MNALIVRTTIYRSITTHWVFKFMKIKVYLLTFILCLLTSARLFSQCTEEKEPDMAKYKRLTETQDAQGCSQCAMLALYLCSARHCVEVEDKRKTRSMIEACKENIRIMGQPYCCPELLNKEPEWGKDANKNAAEGNGSATSDSKSEFDKKLENAIAFGQKLETSFYSMKEVDKNRNELNELSSIKGNFNTVEEIEMAFQAKFNKIASTVDRTVQSENAAMVDQLNVMNHYSGGNEMIVQGIGIAAGLINSIASAERKREYEELLRRQKEEQLRRLKSMKASQVVEVRKALLETFPDGGLPPSSQTIENTTIYVFSFSTNPYSFIHDKPNLSLTNVFPITRKKDSVWMFKNTLIKDLQAHFKNDDIPIILGFFTSENDAKNLRDSFLYLASQCDFNLKFSEYTNQKSTNEKNTSTDFWKN